MTATTERMVAEATIRSYGEMTAALQRAAARTQRDLLREIFVTVMAEGFRLNNSFEACSDLTSHYLGTGRRS